MNKIKENFNYFTTEHKEIYDAYAHYGKLIHEQGGPLDEKTRALMKIVISSVSGQNYALETHINKAFEVLCTKEEMEHAILLTAPSVGFPNMMESIMVLRMVLDKK